MMADTEPEPRDTTTTTTTTGRPMVDVPYLLTPSGILKLVEIIIGIIASGCASLPFFGGVHFFLFVSVTALLCTIILLVLFLFSVQSMASGLPWAIIELIYNCVVTVFYLIASIVLIATAGGIARYVAAAVFGFLNTIAYGVGIYFSFIIYRSTKSSSSHAVTVTA